MSAERAASRGQITFTCNVNSEAQAVYLVGDFNDWQSTAGKMNKGKNGAFQLKMKLAPGEYQYKFIVDGIWFNDPQEDKQAMNPYGTMNSVVRVK